MNERVADRLCNTVVGTTHVDARERLLVTTDHSCLTYVCLIGYILLIIRALRPKKTFKL